jgi:DNA-binding transcriptional regulator GbsR (MarR family)
MDKHESTRRTLISRIGEAASRVGLHRTPAQIYALLLMSEEPLSLDQMATELGVSKASVSVYARELADLGVIRKVWAPDTRRDNYEAEGDIVKVLRLWVQTGIARRIEETGAVIDEAGRYLDEAVSSDEGPMTRVRERIEAAKALHQKLASALGLLPTLLGEDIQKGGTLRQ